MSYYILISGKRDFTDYATFCNILNASLANIDDEIIIVEGGAKGADALAKRYAIEQGYRFIEFPADWNGFGRAAGVIRNAEMINFIKDKTCKALFFWDGQSRGTGDCLMRAKRAGIKCEINYIVNED